MVTHNDGIDGGGDDAFMVEIPTTTPKAEDRILIELSFYFLFLWLAASVAVFSYFFWFFFYFF